MLEKVQADRLAKLEQIKAMGIDPYGWRYDTSEPVASILGRYVDGQEGQVADVAGRVVLLRDMGKMMFAHVRDETGQMQVAFRKNALDEAGWKLAGLLDLGDIVGTSGLLQKSRTGETTIWSDKLTLLAKSLDPMPEKFHGLQDTEIRYRQRYLDLMTNPDSMATFKKRIEIIEHFRGLLKRRGFIEVETPILQAMYGGAAARPFTTHHNSLDCDLFLRISPELYLKRLLVGGMEKVFEIGRNFRNEGIDTRHNPEFTMMELYQAYADYNVMMEITEELVSEYALKYSTSESLQERIAATLVQGSDLDKAFKTHFGDAKKAYRAASSALEANEHDSAHKAADLAQFLLDEATLINQASDDIQKRLSGMRKCAELLKKHGKTALEYGSEVIDYTRPWIRAHYADLIFAHAGVDWKDEPAVRAKAKQLGIEESNKALAVVVNEIFEATVEPALAKPDANGVIKPVFVKDYPAELCPLTRRKPDDPSIALRFECFVANMEIANAYTELNDPAVQEANFAGQLRGEAEGETMRVMDDDFVTSLRHGMPPAGGLGIGIDRVVMLLTNSQSIRDVVLFPLLRPHAR
jgi:lysyl-tRNA synthetase class 2